MCLQALAYWKTILALLFECLSEERGREGGAFFGYSDGRRWEEAVENPSNQDNCKVIIKAFFHRKPTGILFF